MDGLPFPTSATTINASMARPLVSFTSTKGRTRNLSFLRKPKFLVFASKDDPKLDQWNIMEVKFGRLLGEDPKLTLAKILGRKSNPDMSYLEIEKAFNKKKGKIIYEVEEISFNGSNSKEGRSLNSSKGLNLVRPVPKRGVKFESSYNPVVSEAKKSRQPGGKNVENSKSSIPNVILRRPSSLDEDDAVTEKSSKLRIKPNLSLRMAKEQTRKFSDIILLKKPKLTNINLNNNDQRSFSDTEAKVYDDVEESSLEIGSLSAETTSNATLFGKPERLNLDSNIDQGKEFSTDFIGSNSQKVLKENSLKGIDGSDETVNTTEIKEESLEVRDASVSRGPQLDSHSATGLQPFRKSFTSFGEKGTSINEPPEKKVVASNIQFYMEAALQGKPKRFDQSVKEASSIRGETTATVGPENYGNSDELENFLATSPLKEHEDTDWKRAENLVRAGGREEVELISSSARGFVVSFGSLIGFLPYRNLAARWKFLAFESWMRRKGLDPSVYKQNLGIIGCFEISNRPSSLDPSLIPETDHEVEAEISPDMKLEDLLGIYDREKLNFLSSFVGQKIKVNVVLADRISRRLLFSVKPKEKEELVEKKRILMAKLSVGDVVKCCIKKITYFGIFVEVDGVPALIHQTEVSWDATLDPATYFKIGQIVEAKVHQLDFSLERIFLSLKEITQPDPLSETLEAVIGDNHSLVGTLEAAEADTKWVEVESIIEELQRFEGIQSVSKGHFFFSPGLAPTFQVYLASMFENQYKLLARSGNKIQEVIVQTSLGKEEMKSAILTCTNRVV